MYISYKNEKDRALYEDKKALFAKYGKRNAEKIVQRLNELEAAENPQKLPPACSFHEHSGNRKGLFSVNLVHPFRLIVRPTCNYESYVEIISVEIFEVMDPH